MKNIVFGTILILVALLSSVAFSQESPRISKEELKTMLGNPNVIILDVRIVDECKASERFRELPGKTLKKSDHGWGNIRNIRHSYFTAPDQTKRQVPGWHVNL